MEETIEELLSENEALRSAISRSQRDWEKEAALVEQHLETIRSLERALAREQARVLMLETRRHVLLS